MIGALIFLAFLAVAAGIAGAIFKIRELQNMVAKATKNCADYSDLLTREQQRLGILHEKHLGLVLLHDECDERIANLAAALFPNSPKESREAFFINNAADACIEITRLHELLNATREGFEKVVAQRDGQASRMIEFENAKVTAEGDARMAWIRAKGAEAEITGLTRRNEERLARLADDLSAERRANQSKAIMIEAQSEILSRFKEEIAKLKARKKKSVKKK